MYLNQYSVRVVGGNETGSGYVELRHGQTYRLQLHNSNNLRCDAQVEIDGRNVGTWRINGHDSITLERPANDEGKFTFYKLGTSEGYSAQLSNDASLGLLKVTFTPEVEPKPLKSVEAVYSASASAGYDAPVMYGAMPWSGTSKGIDLDTYTTNNTRSMSVSNRSAGGTGLSGHSSQYFSSVAPLEYDYSKQTVIHLRLVCKDDDGPRPLTQHSTPVPPRVY